MKRFSFQKIWTLLGLLLIGCSRPPGSPTPTATQHHHHAAPHGESLIEVGEELAHLELLWKPDSGRLTLYVIDGECEQAIRLKQAQLEMVQAGQTYRLRAVANPLTGETVGDSSQFEGDLPGLRGQTRWNAKLKELKIAGQTFSDVSVEFPQTHS